MVQERERESRRKNFQKRGRQEESREKVNKAKRKQRGKYSVKLTGEDDGRLCS